MDKANNSSQSLTETMTETQELPEEIILNFFSRLPVKSLIRFTSVSKRLRFIILSEVEYEDSLLGISGNHPVEETEQVLILETHHKASQS
ncbi:hypothetical protein ACLB2K_006079 [Fragaria x ananassa]